MLLQPHTPASEEERFVFSLPPGPAQKRLALAAVLAVLAVFALTTAGMLSGIETRRVDAFLPAFLAAMLVCDSITAILLFVQFSILRLRSMLVIASAYLYAALILIPYGLAFPGLLAPAGLIGGLQTAAWLYVLWHCGFPLLVIAYSLSDDRAFDRRVSTRAAIARSVGLTSALVLAATFLCTAGEPLLPAIMLDAVRFGPQWPYLVGAPIATASIAALAVLWIRRRSMLDLWLLVVMFLYLVEVPLSYYPTPARFSAGWYAVRGFGFLASSLVLMVLLHEIQTLYGRLLGAVIALRREREARLMTGDAVAASIAHEVRQPLTAMVTAANAGLRFLDRAAPDLPRARQAFRQIAADGHRAGALIVAIRANSRADLRHRTRLDINDLVQETLALARGELQRHRIRVRAAPNERLPEISGNRVQLQQVLLNLIMNAIEAMASRDEPRVLSVLLEPREGGRVAVTIADTGTGIRSQDADRMFNPLFTTKPGGMGMGLSICRAIVEAHQGQLSFAPNTPRGAVFQFTLRADSPPPAPPLPRYR